MFNCTLKFVTPVRVSVVNGTIVSKEIEDLFEEILGNRNFLPGAEIEVSTEVTAENLTYIPSEILLEQLAQTINAGVTESFNKGPISATVSGNTVFVGYTKITEI
jgi:hypothetical protein